MLLWGFVLFAVAGFVYRRARVAGARVKSMAGTPTLPIGQLEEMRRQVVRPHAEGGFRRVTEVVGVAQPGPGGPLISELGKIPCVWYSYRIRRRSYYHNHHGDRHKRWETVAEGSSSEVFPLTDRWGWTIGVLPAGARVEGVDQPVDRYERDFRPEPVEVFGVRLPSRRGTLGFQYEERVIRPGTWLYVLGEARDVDGPLTIARPEDGRDFVIAAKPEGELRAKDTTRYRLLLTGAIAALVSGLACLVAGFWLF